MFLETLNQLGAGFFNLNADDQKQLTTNIIVLLDDSKKLIAEHPDKFVTFMQFLETQEVRHVIAERIAPDTMFEMAKRLIENQLEDAIFSYFEIFRSPAFLTRIYDDLKWADIILQLMRQSNYTLSRLIEHRLQKYSAKTLFTTIEGETQTDHKWEDVSRKINAYAKGLMALRTDSGNDGPVAFLCENSLDMVLFDLACLSSGIQNIMIPANSVANHVEYILKRTEPSVMIVSREGQLDKIRDIRSQINSLKAVVILSEPGVWEPWLFSPDKVIEKGKSVTDDDLTAARKKITLDDIATIMFTSGTTGHPKGIMFSQQNIVYKRFCRAMAIPKIGDEDRFLSYLPLYHTFGRWFEMTGSIFWGAEYVFMENPSPETMIDNMQRVNPTIFISIPKKWYQLYERVGQMVNIERDPDEDIRQALEELSGGKLQWGLSAAGHLDSDVFSFFQRYGIELMSGFGMTEATGGITMTPPGKYSENSLGKALPGIEIKLAEDGELLIRGPYVMAGYFKPEKGEPEFTDGWLPTGDIMKQDEQGFITIIDRKKEIYKNIKGETIAPQKIENFFREFDFITHVFLVGDHKAFNTLLIYPNYESTEIDLKAMNDNDLRQYFSSVVVSVNRFLAPFERIVDFTLIDRDFSEQKGELTPKGTYKRRVIETNFKTAIDPLYKRNYTPVMVDHIEVRLPNWFLRERGLTANEVSVKEKSIILKDVPWPLPVEQVGDMISIGDFIYQKSVPYIDLAKILVNPSLWLGNETLINFTGKNIFRWVRYDEHGLEIVFSHMKSKPKYDENIIQQLNALYFKNDKSLMGLHLSVLVMTYERYEETDKALNYLETIAREVRLDINPLALMVLRRTAIISALKVQRRAFLKLILLLPGKGFAEIAAEFLAIDSYFIDPEMISGICSETLSEEQLYVLFEITENYAKEGKRHSLALLKLLSTYGAKHPTRYKLIRQFLVRCQLAGLPDITKQAVYEARREMRSGFREWLGPTQSVAVDVETGEEYSWDDVVIFEEGMNDADKDRLKRAISETAMIREAVFLFSSGLLIRLHDVPPGGMWFSLLGREHGKSVYRLGLQTRFQGAFDIAVNINHDLTFKEIIEEINWLICSGTSMGEPKLVEDFGGYWEDLDLWSEEFIHGETAGKFLRRMGRQSDKAVRERISLLWPYFIWSGCGAYISFWQRTGRSLELLDPNPANIIIPRHDYHMGSRIVSISFRRKHESLVSMVHNLWEHFVAPTEKEYEFLAGAGKWQYIFSAFLEKLGEKEGLVVLSDLRNELQSGDGAFTEQISQALDLYLPVVQEKGYIPKKLYFAIRRYYRWLDLNDDATAKARATFVLDLYKTYELEQLEQEYQDTRTRFFLKTVFDQAQPELKAGLEEIMLLQRQGKMPRSKKRQFISALQKKLKLNEDEEYFLARLTYPHLKPTDYAELISLETGGVARANLVVRMEDYDGETFYIRTPVNPKEISKLYQLFLSYNLPVQFRPEHKYLIAVNERGTVIGGLFYLRSDEQSAYLEKIVVSGFYRKKGVSDAIMNEMFKRLHGAGLTSITTGFFRPEYFYRFGFRIERKYAGLVKKLDEDLADSVSSDLN